MFIDKTKFEHIGTLTNTGATDVEWHFPEGAQVKRVILVATTAATATSVVNVDKNGTAIGSIAVPTVADNGLVYADLGHVDPDGAVSTIDDSLVLKGGVTYRKYAAGDYLTLEASGTANSGVFECYVEYIPEGLNEAEVVTEIVFTPA
jgi:hypothetical protein